VRTAFLLTVVASCLAGTIAVAGPQYGPGVTDTEIKLGQTLPYSGAVSAIGIPMAGATQALLRKVNQAGGVNGRKINLLSLDDGFSAPKTVEQTRRLVEGDEVLAIVGSFGTSPNAAIQKYLNAKKVPQLFIMSGSSRFLAPKEFPWTMPWPVSSERIGKAYGRYVRQSKPDAKVSIIYQNDEYGRQVENGIREGLGADADKVIIAERTYDVTDPTLDSQMASLKASDADVLFHVSIPKFAAQGLRKVSELGWRPLQFVDLPSASIAATFKPVGLEKAVGVISATYFKDPMDPKWKDDVAVADYMTTMKTFAPDIDPADSHAMFGYSIAESIVVLLRQCGNDLSRENLMRQATNLKQVPLSLLLPGITLNTTSQDYAPMKQLQLMRFNGTSWDPFGEVMTMP
jgi:branched-chain amino acid transport system substrate-binding protein